MKILFESDSFSIGTTLTPAKGRKNSPGKNTPDIDGSFFRSIKDAVMGKKYELSLVFVGTARMRGLNKTHRKKDCSTDILSFDLSDTTGEIFINPEKAKAKARDFDRSFESYIKYLFVHGLLHLKGHDHEDPEDGLKMSQAEKKICKAFKI